MRQRRAQLRERRHKASVPTVALVGYTNAGKTTLFNVLTRAGRRSVERAVRDARSARAPGAAARQPRAAGVGHRRLHRSAAARAGRRVSRDARRGRRRGPGAARHRRGGAATATAGWRPCARCSKRSAPIDVPLIEVYNKCDLLTADERRRLQEQDPASLCISALTRRRDRRARGHAGLAAGAGRPPGHAHLRPRRSRRTASGSPGCTGMRACSSTKPATAASPSSPTFRDVSKRHWGYDFPAIRN